MGAIGVYTDASAAIGMTQRLGVGKVRHIDVGMLWVQQSQRTGEIDVKKVDTRSNPADVFTKHVPGEVVWRHLTTLGFESRQGRAEAAVKLVEVPQESVMEIPQDLPQVTAGAGDSNPCVRHSQGGMGAQVREEEIVASHSGGDHWRLEEEHMVVGGMAVGSAAPRSSSTHECHEGRAGI